MLSSILGKGIIMMEKLNSIIRKLGADRPPSWTPAFAGDRLASGGAISAASAS
jgi:hypothetical protein